MSQDPNDGQLPVSLPEGLRRQFDDLRARLWRVETLAALCAAAAGLIFSWLALFISDRFWDTPHGWRIALHLTGLAVAAVAFYFWARRRWWKRRSTEDLALLVQRAHRTLGDRLLGIVELSHEKNRPAGFSPALYHAAIQQVASEAAQHDFGKSVDVRAAKKLAAVAAVAAGCLGAAAVALPGAARNAFARWIAPASNEPRYSLVALEGLTTELIVPHGEAFEVSGSVRYRSFWHPRRVVARLLTGVSVEGDAVGGAFKIQIPGQVEDGPLRLRAGDASASVNVRTVFRPSLRALSADIKLPSYLQYPAESNAVTGGSLSIVEGSAFTLHGATSRPLASAEMQNAGETVPLSTSGDTFSSAPITPEGHTDLTLTWKDELGLSNAAPLRVAVATVKDAPPVVELPGYPRESAMLESDVAHIKVTATDDYGVADFGLTWQVESATPSEESGTAEVKAMAATPQSKSAEKVFNWSPRAWRIPTDSTVELTGCARDYLPGRERSRTAPCRIRILTPEQHADLVRQQLEAAMERIEEVTRQQEKVANGLHEAKENTASPEAQKTARIAQSAAGQMDNSAKLEELSQQAAASVREAAKNPLVLEENIRQWAESARQWHELAQKKMRDAAASMQSARQAGPKSQKELSEATEKADAILQQLQQLQQTAAEHMDQLQALTLADRLRAVGTKEGEVGARLIRSASNTIGLLPEELSAEFQRLERQLNTDHAREEKESGALQSEISRFFERTKKTNYGAVSQEMKAAHTPDELERLGGLIDGNVTIQAAGGLALWSTNFKKWGDALEPKDSNGGGEGKSGKPDQKKDMTKTLIALLRLRESEMNLRDQTALAEQGRAPGDAYKAVAATLAESQHGIEGRLDGIHQDAAVQELEAAFAESADDMRAAATVLQSPETGKPADIAEAKTIDALTDLVNLINEQSQHPKPQSKPGGQKPGDEAEEMAFLTRMMQKPSDSKAMAVQPGDGYHRTGGQANGPGRNVSGDPNGKSAAAREVEKAAGAVENAPAEFREALDNYYHAIEQSKE